jgi:outer membrane lipoprotein-sorting protein
VLRPSCFISLLYFRLREKSSIKLKMGKSALILVLSTASCAFLLLAASQAATSSGGTSAAQLVRDSATALSKLHSYELNVIFNQSINDGKYIRTVHSYVETSFEQSGGRKHIRMVSRKAADTMTIVSDGHGYWIYHENNRRYQHRAGHLPPQVYRGVTPGFSDTLSAESLPVSMQSANIVRQETVAVEDRKELCDVVLVQLKPNAAPPDYGIQNDEVTLWISREYHIPIKVSATFIQKGKDGKSQAMDMTILVQRFRPNPTLPLSTWTFVPPPDSQPESNEPGTATK